MDTTVNYITEDINSTLNYSIKNINATINNKDTSTSVENYTNKFLSYRVINDILNIILLLVLILLIFKN